MKNKTSRLAAALWACGVLGAAAQTPEPPGPVAPQVPVRRDAVATAAPGASPAGSAAPASAAPAPAIAAPAAVPATPSAATSAAPASAPAAAPVSAPTAAVFTPDYYVPGATVSPAAAAASSPAGTPAPTESAEPLRPGAAGSAAQPTPVRESPATVPALPDAAALPPNPITGTEVAPPVDQVVETPALREDLWGRVRRGYALPPLQSDLVRKWEQYYSTKPEYLQRMFDRGGRYLFHIVEELGKRAMPTELALLPFIESAFNPLAQSAARASGMWQFMPATGRHFDLRQNLFRDDRRSVIESTRAALDYLKQLNTTFGDWQLALAAYNWGQGNVARAQNGNRKSSRGTAYGELPMPDETRNYVPKLQAFANIVARPQDYGVQLPGLENHPYFLTVRVDRDIDVALAARLAGLPLDEFQALNPQMNKPVILAAGTPMLLLPFDNARRFQAEVSRHKGPFASWTAWVAPRTLKPAEAAQAVGMGEQELREINRIPPRMLVKAGSTLLVPRGASVQRDVSEHLADTASIALAPETVPGRKRMARVGPRGESVAAVARRYKVAPAQLAQWNGVSAGGSFKGGQQVVVGFVAGKAAARGRGHGTAVARAPSAGKGQASGARKTAASRQSRAVAKAPARKAVKVAKR